MREEGHEHLIGRTIAGKFVVEELLGAGAMGAVYRARQIALEKTVAIKVMHGEHAHDAMFAARFHREAKAASRLNHPNSMQVIDFGAEPDGLLYIAMEYLDGRSLHRLLREEWPLPATRIADITMQMLAALAVAHDMGVVHRDLKPENVMVLRSTDDDGRPKDLVKVCDFGIAKITDSRAYRGSGERESNAPVTTAGFLVGTPEYMSPEQGRGDRLGPCSDLYSVGIMLFEMLTRRVPFEAENAIGVVLKHVAEIPPRPSELVLGIEPRLEAVCLQALRKNVDERYRSAREMRAALRAVLDQVPSPTPVARDTVAQRPLPDPRSIASTTHDSPAFRSDQRAWIEGAAQTTPLSDAMSPKPTLLGTATTIPGLPKRRALVIATGALATGAIMAAAVLVVARSHARIGGTPSPVNETKPAPSGSIASQIPAVGSDTTAAEPSAPSPIASHAAGRAKTAPIAWSSSKGTQSTSAGATPSAATALPAPPSNPTVAMAAALSAPIAVLPPTGAQAPDALDPSFDPDRGYVEVGLVNAQGVREAAVRGTLRGVGLARCYRGALRLRGARTTGAATLSLSFDEMGLARSAIVTGADFLPGLARCLQAASSGVRIPRAHVEPGGGTAEVILAFKMPP